MDELLPEELKLSFLPLVAVFGLNTSIISNKILWELLTNVDQRTINYIKIDHLETQIPQGKPERTSYEWYIPKGILKSTWLQKHVHQIPAVVVCFADLDWNDPAWPEKKAEVIEKVQQLKSIIGTRRCKVALVLIQRGIPLPPGEDPLAAERAGILCQACDIPAKYLLALPSHADHLHGYTRRLESAFLDMAQNYYLGEARRVKSHREQLNKINHAYLYVRHSFKIAVYCELRQDQSNALKHYTQAYENLLQVRISDNNLNEIKTVAIIIAYKIWRINFLQNQPRESINHFKNHIDHFRGIAGHKELEFEQQAWLAQQYEIFAMLFEEAVAAGLSATQKEHPGFYFQQAGLHAQLRKKLSKESLESGIRPADEAPLNTPTGFYGQRPWRREKISMEPAAPAIESEEISYLKLVESKYDHCKHIISLLSRALVHFENQKSPGHKRRLMSTIALEHYEAGNFREAVRILHPLFWELRCDDWWSLLTNLLKEGLKASYMAGLRSDYFTIGAELCSVYSCLSKEEKERIFSNLLLILEGKQPLPEEGTKDSASSVWEAKSCVATIALNTVASLIDVRAAFQKNVYSCEEDVIVEVYLRNLTFVPLTVSRVAVTLSNPMYSEICQTSEPVVINTGQKEVKLTFSVHCSPADVGIGFSILSVSTFMGNLSGRYVLFHSEGFQAEEFSLLKISPELNAPRRPWNAYYVGEGMPQPTVEIRPRKAKVTLEFNHDQPALSKDWYPVTIYCINNESADIEAIELFVSPHLEKQPVGHYVRIASSLSSIEDSSSMKEITVKIPILKANSKSISQIFVESAMAGNVTVNVKVVYTIAIKRGNITLSCPSVSSYSTSMQVVDAFKAVSENKTIGFQPLSKVFLHQEFLLMCYIKANSQHSLTIKSCEFKSSDFEADSSSGTLKDLVINSDECATEVWALKPIKTRSYVGNGEICVTWMRKGSSSPYITSVIPLPSLSVDESPLDLKMEIPPQAFIRQPILAKVILKSLHNVSQKLRISMDSNDAFMFAGNKMMDLTIEPLATKTLTYNLYPLLAGYVALPTFRLSPVTVITESEIVWTPEFLSELVERSIPSHIYVLPQSKLKNKTLAEE
ncbi:trafficking protein particle complex subunit 11-like isoform X2 [Artemia franciscana]|uniref:trafficking protein particle complex subunit 11-like isoform X2 n=1 Tax=Artemia franciscana TaxID=6661 RepID=UPI0032D9FAA0